MDELLHLILERPEAIDRNAIPCALWGLWESSSLNRLRGAEGFHERVDGAAPVRLSQAAV